MSAKVDIDSHSSILVGAEVVDKSEPEAVDEPDPEVIDEPESEPEVEETLIETFVNLPAEPTMKMSFSPTMIFFLSLRSPDVDDPFQIFLQKTSSQEIGALICGLIFQHS